MKWVVFLIQEQQDTHTSVESGYSLCRKQAQLAFKDEDLTALSTHEIDVSRVSCKQPKTKSEDATNTYGYQIELVKQNYIWCPNKANIRLEMPLVYKGGCVVWLKSG